MVVVEDKVIFEKAMVKMPMDEWPLLVSCRCRYFLND